MDSESTMIQFPKKDKSGIHISEVEYLTGKNAASTGFNQEAENEIRQKEPEKENLTKIMGQESLEAREETSSKLTHEVVESEYKAIQERDEEGLNQMQYIKMEQLSDDEEMGIMRKIKTFKLPLGMAITNYMFFKRYLEVCYIFEGDVPLDENKLDLLDQLSAHLDLHQNSIKLTKLKGKPIYKETFGPGETLSVKGRTYALGALVKVEGKGTHALMSGHGKQQGDIVYSSTGTPVGTVNVALQGKGEQKDLDDPNWCLHRDGALVQLDNPGDYDAHVTMQGDRVGLKEDPGEAQRGMRVKRYTTDGREGNVHRYMRPDFETNIDHRFLGVTRDDDDGPIHVEGESGTLIVKRDVSDGRAEAVGMLTETVQLSTDPPRESSLAVHMTATFTALQNDPYCGGSQIQFVQP